MIEPYYQRDGITLYCGDCLDVIDGLSELGEKFDAVVMDPPYASGTRKEMGKTSSGAMLRGGRFADRPIELDQMTTQGFVWLMRAVGIRTRGMLPDGGSVLSFIDWRQWPNLVGALETCNLRVQGMVVWDKQTLGMGNGFRRKHKGCLSKWRSSVGSVYGFGDDTSRGSQYRPASRRGRVLRGALPHDCRASPTEDAVLR